MNSKKKVAVVGAGNVGGTTAMRIFESDMSRVALIDVVANVARAKSGDFEDAQYSLGISNRIDSSGDFSLMDGADIVVVTAGLPRKPGMTREDLLQKNADIMIKVTGGIVQFAPDAIVIVVSNPLDVMTYLAFKKTNFPRTRVFGMGASLDTARFANVIAKKMLVGTDQVKALVIGSHGETMLPLPRLSSVREKPLEKCLAPRDIENLVMQTKQRGAEIVGLYGSGSAYYGPSAAIYDIVATILTGKKKEIPVSVCLDGEYGLRDVAIGVPAQIGPRGIEKVISVDLTPVEQEAFDLSAQAIKDSIKALNLS